MTINQLDIPDNWTPEFFEKIKVSARHWLSLTGRECAAVGDDWVQYKPELGEEKPLMGAGVDKVVVIPADIGTVIKINRLDVPITECRVRLEAEYILYLRSKFPTFAQYFPNVLYVADGVALMQKLRVDNMKWNRQLKDIKAVGAKLGVVNDLHSGNIGWLGDKWFFIDIAHDMGELDYDNYPNEEET